MELDLDEKRKSILNSNQNLLVIGGPGCGKTTIALAKAFRFIEKGNLNRGQKVLFLSFSRNAKARILESANRFSEHKEFGSIMYVQTFHAFFLEIIKTYGYLLGTKRKISIMPPHDEKALKAGRLDDDISWNSEKDSLFQKEGVITFDRFSSTMLELIAKSEKIRLMISNTFPLIIVDEAQDTDSDQWEIIKRFDSLSQLFLLGDVDQQIFEYRSNVNPERLNHIQESLNPTTITLGNENYRSRDTEILNFARDILNETPRNGLYMGVSTITCPPQAAARDSWIIRCIGIINSEIQKKTGKPPRNIAILSPWSRGVKMISKALRFKNIPHKVQFDEVATNLSSRLIACLLEPVFNENDHLISVLLIFRDYYSANAKTNDVEKFNRWIELIIDEKQPRGKVVPYFQGLISDLMGVKFSGNPARDWRYIQGKLLGSNQSIIVNFVKHSEFLMVYNRGRIIMRDLINVWVEQGAYFHAREILQSAVVEAQLSSDVTQEDGINVMTTYKSKGKEFDGVIIFHDQYSSPIELRGDDDNFSRSRKLLFVAVTRACHHVLILRQAGSQSEILDVFKLR